MTTDFNMNDTLAQAEKEWGVGDSKGSWYKIVEGKNRVRILSPLIAYASHFKVGACVGKTDCPECKKMVKVKTKKGEEKDVENKPMVKFLCHVLDYTDNEIKLAQFAYAIAKAIQDLQNDPDWAFTTAPMPYDITINAENAGKKEVSYGIVASPNKVPVSDEILKKLEKLHTPDQVKEMMKTKRMKELGLIAKDNEGEYEYPENEVKAEDVPF